jgi:hypothetical protein
MNNDTTYRYGNREYSREELRNAVEAEAAGLPPEQWLFGKFEFDEWLSDCLITGHVERVDYEGP